MKIYNGESHLNGSVYKDTRVGAISHLYVASDSRGRDVGIGMFYDFLRICEEEQIEHIVLSCHEKNPVGLNFWEKIGFTIDAQEPDDYYTMLCSVEDLGYLKKIREAGILLKNFCESEGAEFLYSHGLDHGFLDGGCKILADVLMSMDNVFPEKHICSIGRKGIVDHAALCFMLNGNEYYMDANGLQTKKEVISNMADELCIQNKNNVICVSDFDELDEGFMDDLRDSCFSLYEDLDIVRTSLKAKLEEIGFLEIIGKSPKLFSENLLVLSQTADQKNDHEMFFLKPR